MTRRAPTDDKLDDVLAELEAARSIPSWTPEEHQPGPRRLIRAPEAMSQGHWVPQRRVVILVALCAVLAAIIFGARTLLSSAGESSPAVAVPASVKGTPSASAVEQGPSKHHASSPPSTRWSVHVVGAVRRPGVVSVPSGARVADAVAAAGGLSEHADTSGINLARPLTDGEQVHVPRPGEKWTPPVDARPGPGADAGPGAPEGIGGSSGDASAPGGGSGELINLNSASLEQLDSLPGVGPVMAQRILDWRKEHGKFSNVDELNEVSGIGEKTLAKLKPKVTV